MLNKVWFWLVVIGIVYGFAKGTFQTFIDATSPATKPAAESIVGEEAGTSDNEEEHESRGLMAMGQKLNAAVLDAADVSVTICIGLIGIMALWLGVMKIASDAGLVEALARILSPLMRWLFPDVPDGHPAQGAMLMNISANMLGLENAATPLGLKAMQELQTLNRVPDTATNAMAMFLAINTSNVTLIPFTIIGYRVLNGSTDPAAPVAGTLLVTGFATLVAVIAAKYFSQLPRYRVPEGERSQDFQQPIDKTNQATPL